MELRNEGKEGSDKRGLNRVNHKNNVEDKDGNNIQDWSNQPDIYST